MEEIEQFAQRLKADYPEVNFCYIAVMGGDANYALEVEIDEGTIASTFFTEIPVTAANLGAARILADALDAALTRRGVKVFATRSEWETFLDDED